MKALLSRPTSTHPESLDDLFLCMAATIEDSLIENGAVPGKDYSILDLYRLAQPFALHVFKQPSCGVTFTDSWPLDD